MMAKMTIATAVVQQTASKDLAAAMALCKRIMSNAMTVPIPVNTVSALPAAS